VIGYNVEEGGKTIRRQDRNGAPCQTRARGKVKEGITKVRLYNAVENSGEPVDADRAYRLVGTH
jgi:hypothetical protein